LVRKVFVELVGAPHLFWEELLTSLKRIELVVVKLHSANLDDFSRICSLDEVNQRRQQSRFFLVAQNSVGLSRFGDSVAKEESAAIMTFELAQNAFC